MLFIVCIRLDEVLMTVWLHVLKRQLKEFNGKELKSTTKKGLGIDNDDEKKKLEDFKAEIAPFTKLMKEMLGDKTEKKIVSTKLADSFCVFTTSVLMTSWSNDIEMLLTYCWHVAKHVRTCSGNVFVSFLKLFGEWC